MANEIFEPEQLLFLPEPPVAVFPQPTAMTYDGTNDEPTPRFTVDSWYVSPPYEEPEVKDATFDHELQFWQVAVRAAYP